MAKIMQGEKTPATLKVYLSEKFLTFRRLTFNYLSLVAIFFAIFYCFLVVPENRNVRERRKLLNGMTIPYQLSWNTQL